MSNDPDDKQSEDGGHSSLIIGLLAVPFFYVFSVGPAAALYDHVSPGAQKTIEAIYLPLEWVDEKLPTSPISSYADLWR